MKCCIRVKDAWQVGAGFSNVRPMAKKKHPDPRPMTFGEHLAKRRLVVEAIKAGATNARIVRLHGISAPTINRLRRYLETRADYDSNTRIGRRPGSGGKAIPAAEYLIRWSPVVEALKAGMTARAIKRKFGTCTETVSHVRRFMVEGGWTPPPQPVKPGETRLRPPRMSGANLMAKYPDVVFWLREGKIIAQAAKLAGVSYPTARTVKRAMRANGEVL